MPLYPHLYQHEEDHGQIPWLMGPEPISNSDALPFLGKLNMMYLNYNPPLYHQGANTYKAIWPQCCFFLITLN